jgi:peptide chain release factor 1
MSKLPVHQIVQQYDELNETLSTVSNTAELIKLSKQQKKLMPQAEIAHKIIKLEKAIGENNELLASLKEEDAEIKELTELDLNEKTEEVKNHEEDLLSYLAPTDERDDGNVMMEVRAGAGGDESSLFAADLLRMYTRLCEREGYKLKIISTSVNDLGGYKEVIAEIRGDGAFSWFKYEGGVHRVQRVPSTEKQGRIHTSTAAVVVMPLIEEGDNNFKLDSKDIEIIYSTSSGNGGQSVNTTYSAVRMKHTPTGMEAQSQDEKNQIQNKAKCLQVLTSRVYDFYEQQKLEKEAAERKDQVKTMDRSEKIRTYNYPQDRVTDHRYSHSWNQLPAIMEGDIELIVKDIKKFEAEKTLQELNQ